LEWFSGRNRQQSRPDWSGLAEGIDDTDDLLTSLLPDNPPDDNDDDDDGVFELDFAVNKINNDTVI